MIKTGTGDAFDTAQIEEVLLRADGQQKGGVPEHPQSLK
jgi:hypothetical protein